MGLSMGKVQVNREQKWFQNSPTPFCGEQIERWIGLEWEKFIFQPKNPRTIFFFIKHLKKMQKKFVNFQKKLGENFIIIHICNSF
jgi:hypothetical protein